MEQAQMQCGNDKYCIICQIHYIDVSYLTGKWLIVVLYSFSSIIQMKALQNIFWSSQEIYLFLEYTFTAAPRNEVSCPKYFLIWFFFPLVCCSVRSRLDTHPLVIPYMKLPCSNFVVLQFRINFHYGLHSF